MDRGDEETQETPHHLGASMNEELKGLKDKMPTERKSAWRTPEERRMSDLTRVLEWLERRQGKKKKEKSEDREKTPLKGSEKVVPKPSPAKLQAPAHHRVMFAMQPGAHPHSKAPGKASKKEESNSSSAPKSILVDGKRRRMSTSSSSSAKEHTRKSELDIKDVIALETNQRPFRQQSIVEPMLQDILFPQRRSTLFREWAGKTSEALYERRLKNLIEKVPEPKVETVKMLKPEEVLSCRYLRLSKNNVRTLLKLCKDAGMNVDIHPHMVEGEIDGQKVFGHNPSITL